MDKWFIFTLILVLIASVAIIVARRQGINEIEKTKTNPSADDFEIIEG